MQTMNSISKLGVVPVKEGLFCVYKLVVLEDDAVAAEAAVCAVAASPFADRCSVSTALNADALEKMLGGGGSL